MGPQLCGQVAEIGREPDPRVVLLGAFRLELPGDLVDLRGLLLGLLAACPCLRDRLVLRIREDGERDDQQ